MKPKIEDILQGIDNDLDFTIDLIKKVVKNIDEALEDRTEELGAVET